MKKNQGIFLFLFICFLLITIFIFTNKIVPFDDWIYEKVISIRNNSWDSFYQSITVLGNTTTVVVIVGLLLILLKKQEKYLLGITILSTVGINQLLKFIFHRARPEHLRLIVEKGYSFPSGHAMISIALYGFIIYCIYKKVSNSWIKSYFIFIFLLLIIGIGLSRIYLGVHYPSDILGGYTLSLIILLFIIEKVPNYFRGDKND